MQEKRSRHGLRLLAGLLTLITIVATIARELPETLQALPFVPVLVSATPWFIILALLAVLLSLAAKRWGIALIALLCLVVQIWWQFPFFRSDIQLPPQANQAVAAAHPNTDDAYARVMTLNVYQGRADVQEIVNLVRDQRVEVLALEETTSSFVEALNKAGIEQYLPYSQVASSDGKYGNGLWSATPLQNPRDDDVNSSASFMPGGTVSFDGGASSIRFVAVHTTSPKEGYWGQWRKSLDELAQMRSHTNARYIFMGDFNATMDHTPFRNFLGSRFSDATYQSGHGLTFTWPNNKSWLPRFCGIDHIILDKGITAGQMEVASVNGSDHAALLATIAVAR